MLNHKSMRRVFFCAVLSVLPSAQARLVPVAITGTVTRVRERISPRCKQPPCFPPKLHPNPLGGKVKEGDAIVGIFIYDSSTPNTYDPDDPPPQPWHPVAEDRGLYEYATPPYGITVFAGEIAFATDPEQVEFSIQVEDNGSMYLPEWHDAYTLTSLANLPLPDGRLVETIRLHAWGDEDLLPDAGLPTFFPAADRWATFYIVINGSNETGGSFSIDADVTSVAVIPEPATFALFGGAGLLFLSKHGKCRRKR